MGRHFPDNIFKCFFLNENVPISFEISLTFVPRSPINNIPALVCQPGDTSLSELMMVSLLMHICVTRPEWVKEDWLTRVKKPVWWLEWWIAITVSRDCQSPLIVMAMHHLHKFCCNFPAHNSITTRLIHSESSSLEQSLLVDVHRHGNFFLKLIVTHRLCVIFVKTDSYSNV